MNDKTAMALGASEGSTFTTQGADRGARVRAQAGHHYLHERGHLLDPPVPD